ncbi:hypothetical protein EAG_00723 [Camponotus floridanus]|uniref:Uncharacterized protein n=1 Tax=Camponotus floridanus TaxID=104421 RepID=E2AU71_CAMFO|nr:hypothetical protein EAG_00723 [Camponotus floridanus]
MLFTTVKNRRQNNDCIDELFAEYKKKSSKILEYYSSAFVTFAQATITRAKLMAIVSPVQAWKMASSRMLGDDNYYGVWLVSDRSMTLMLDFLSKRSLQQNKIQIRYRLHARYQYEFIMLCTNELNTHLLRASLHNVYHTCASCVWLRSLSAKKPCCLRIKRWPLVVSLQRRDRCPRSFHESTFSRFSLARAMISTRFGGNELLLSAGRRVGNVTERDVWRDFKFELAIQIEIQMDKRAKRVDQDFLREKCLDRRNWMPPEAPHFCNTKPGIYRSQASICCDKDLCNQNLYPVLLSPDTSELSSEFLPGDPYSPDSIRIRV